MKIVKFSSVRETCEHYRVSIIKLTSVGKTVPITTHGGESVCTHVRNRAHAGSPMCVPDACPRVLGILSSRLNQLEARVQIDAVQP